MKTMAVKVRRCVAAASALGVEDTRRFVESHDGYIGMGMKPIEAARRAAADLLAEIHDEAAQIAELVNPLLPVAAPEPVKEQPPEVSQEAAPSGPVKAGEPTAAERDRLLAEMGARNQAKIVENAQQIADKTGDTRLLDQERAKLAALVDVGSKIGGARKDTAVSTGQKSEKSADDTPAWRKRFQVSQIAKSSRPGEEGRWSLTDTRNVDYLGQPKQVGSTFSTKEEAEAAIPLAAVSLKHRVVQVHTRQGEGTDAYEIIRAVSDRKRVKVVDQTFPTRDDAVRYMVEHAIDILETKTSFGEEILPKPDNVTRTGKERRTADAKPDDFLRDFKLRAVEFGNWNNQAERQDVVNHAYDALADLADVIGIPPAAIGLNGELALAFGARGQGLSGARAHYEADYGVINLTKMSGAGSLAHEWLHALDHYLGRQDGKAPAERKLNKSGDMVFDANGPERDLATHGFKHSGSGVRQELRDAYTTLVQTMFKKTEQYVEDTQRTEKFVGTAKTELAEALQSLRNDLAEQKDKRYYKTKSAPATAEQLAAFDAIAERMIAGEMLATEWRSLPSKRALAARWTNDALEQLSAINKAVRGRSGFDATNRSGTLDRLRGSMNRYGERLRMLAQAQAGEVKIKQVPTSFAMEAKSIDQGRSSDYWTTPHEMAARAFQAYVEDKIADGGGTSEFLTYGTNAVVLTPWGWKRPFPTGDERKAINAAFDKFLGEFKTRDGDNGNVAMFSRKPQTERADAWIYRFWASRTWASETEARDMIRRRIVEDNERYAGMFKPNDPATVDGLEFVRAPAPKSGYNKGVPQVKLKQAKAPPAPFDRIGEPVDSEGTNRPRVDWESRDMIDDGTADSVLQAYGRGHGNVYRAWVDPSLIPAPKGGGIVGGYPDMRGGYDWSELAGQGSPPPLKLRVGKNGKLVLMDGNHRLAWWREKGVSEVPAYIIDERPQAMDVPFSRKPGEPMGAKSGAQFNREQAVANLPATVRDDPFFGRENPAMRDVHARGALWDSLQAFGEKEGLPAFALGVDEIGNIVVGGTVPVPNLKALTGFADAKGVGIYVLSRSRPATEASIPLLRSIGFEPVLGLGGYEQGRYSSTSIQAGAATFAYKPRGISEFMFSRNAPEVADAQGIARIQQLVESIRSKWANAPEVVVVKSLQDEAVPEAVRTYDKGQRSTGAAGEPEGFFYKGKVYLIADQLGGDADVRRVLLHEALGHFGLRGVFGQELGTILDRIATLNAGKVRTKAKQYGLDYDKQSERRAAAEEVLAEMAQENPQLGWVQRAIAAIRTWLRENIPGAYAMKLSDAELIRNFILPARQFVKAGEITVQRNMTAAPSLSRSADDRFDEYSKAYSDGQTRLTYKQWMQVHSPAFKAWWGSDWEKGAKDGAAEGHRGLPDGRGNAGVDSGNAGRPFVEPATGVPRVFHHGDGSTDGIRFSRSLGAALGKAAGSVRDVNLAAGYKVADLMDSAGKLSVWHTTVGSQYNLAQRSPEFKRVFDGVQNFLNDASYYTNEAANLAPKVLPKLEGWRDIFKSPLSAADTKAISAPISEGTLTWARDAQGKAVRIDDLQAAADAMDSEQKARALFKGGHLSEQVLKMWQGLPIEQFEKIIGAKYERDMLKAGVVWTPAELKAQFNATGDLQPDGKWSGQIGLYNEFRAATDESLSNLAVSEMLNYAGKDANDVRAQALDLSHNDAAVLLRDHLFALAEADPARADALNETANKMIDIADHATDMQARGYAPLSRFGTYTLEATLPTGERYFSLFETTRERAKMQRTLAAAGATGIGAGTMSQEDYKLLNGISPETAALFGEMLGFDSQGSEAKDLAFQTFIKKGTANRSAMKRLLKRQGIAGFSADAGRVLAGFVYSNGRKTSSNLHMGEVSNAVNEMDKQGGELKDAAVRLAEYVKNPQEEAHGLRALLFAQYLGGSVASAMVNATQPFTVTFPYLSQFGGIQKAGARLAAALKVAGKATTGDPVLDKALAKAAEQGLLSPQEVHQLMAQAQGKAALKSGDGTALGNAAAQGSNVLSKVALAWGKVFSVAEQFNRRVTFIAAWRTAIEQGIADPAGFAAKAVNQTQFIANKGNKAQWGRGAIGGTLMTFKSFTVQYLELLQRMATAGEPGSPERAAGRKAALLAVAVLFLMGGADGLPFEGNIEDLIDGFMQHLGYNFDSKAKKREFFANLLGEDMGRFMNKGLWGLPGVPIDASVRFGLGRPLPGTGLLLKKSSHTNDLVETVGPVGDLAKRSFDALGRLVDGDFAGAGKAMSPVAARNVIKGIDMLKTGEYHDEKENKIIDTTPTEAVAKMIGFQPNNVAKMQSAASDVFQMKDVYAVRRSEISAAMARAMYDHDADAITEVRASVKRWNEDNPATPIHLNMPAIVKKVRTMREDKATRLEKASPKAVRAEVRKQMAEAGH